MRRKLTAALAIAVTSVGLTLVTAAPASAAPSIRCGTADYAFTIIDAVAGGQIKIVGTKHYDYVGHYLGLGGTYRIWHHTYSANGGGTHYTGALAVQCNAASEEVNVVDLSRDTLTASDHPKCGTISYTVGSNSYTYIGSRFNDGDRFRYWGQVVYGDFFVFRGPAAVRCD